MLESPAVGQEVPFHHPLLNSTKTAKKLYVTLFNVASEVAHRRGYKAQPSQVAFFVPVEIVAYALGVARSTIYRNLPALREAGLIDQRGHYTSYNGETRSDGSVWAVRLDPMGERPAKLHHDELSYQYRDLAGDIAEGKTAFAAIEKMRQSNTEEKHDEIAEEIILGFIPLPPVDASPALSLTVPFFEGQELSVIYDVPEVHKSDRKQAVNHAATACADYLDDLVNINFYRWLMWRALTLYWQEIHVFNALYHQVFRAGIDRKEGYARNAAALFVHRLKQSEVWAQMRSLETQDIRLVTKGRAS